eukprot:CAMPEP_0113634192 /NCGR_PEP_ID=MMETSP0017_2-20120614/17801_1 /TAXON_ID=2856 /ORGANISM="Cylindrotheca closterium" /LENGTH=125 /DNA_ID=CAMNT_0000544875 /DNA_START=18 /DNA_END=395 /DNA_ORIENTATION=+ /assembly_acc=CAM_ASM_000147
MTCFRFILSCFLLVVFLVESTNALANQHHPHGPSDNGSSSLNSNDQGSSSSAHPQFGVYSSGESALFGGGGTLGSYYTDVWMGRKDMANHYNSNAQDASTTFLPHHLRRDNEDQVDGGRFNAYGN